MTLRLWCSCGGALDARSSSPAALASVRRAWDAVHDGDGHGPATARQAADARWRQNTTTAAYREKARHGR